MSTTWPEFHREDDQADRLEAISLCALVQLQWRRDYARQRPEIRKRQPRRDPGDDD